VPQCRTLLYVFCPPHLIVVYSIFTNEASNPGHGGVITIPFDM
jgi:hypothetical protein